MIKGIGCDIVRVERMAKSVENSNFCQRFFSEAENEYFLLKNYNPQTIAAAFAAKEAFSKALGTGIRGFRLREVEVLHDDMGKPYIRTTGNAQRLAANAKIHLSLSHEREYAAAFVIIEE